MEEKNDQQSNNIVPRQLTDSVNDKYNKLLLLVEEESISYRNTPINLFEKYKELLYSSYLTMKNDHSFLNYKIMVIYRYLRNMIEKIPCLSCGSIYHFGLYDTYCNICINKYVCPGAKTCILSIHKPTGKRGDDINSATCLHENSENIILNSTKRWNYLLNNSRPEFFTKRSGKDVFIDCLLCYHTSKIRIIGYMYKNCKYCCEGSEEFCDDLSCKFCHDKSFASSPKSKFVIGIFDKTTNPRFIALKSNTILCFYCPICIHVFETSPHSISRGNGCPYCCHAALCNREECKFCESNSFMMSEMKEYWHYPLNNGKKPRDVFLSSNYLFYFICEYGHIFLQTPNRITDQGNWCNQCLLKTESKIYRWLNNTYIGYPISHPGKFDWLRGKSGRFLPFDFIIFNRIIIELDGPQHFWQVSVWEAPEIIRQKDVYKMKMAIKYGYHVIRILQKDIWRDTFDWQLTLKIVIQRLLFDSNPHCEYIENPSNTSVYTNHINDFNNFVSY